MTAASDHLDQERRESAVSPVGADAPAERPAPFRALELHSLEEAEAFVSHLNRVDLVVRLRIGQAYTQILRKGLYREGPEGFKEFSDYLKFRSPISETRVKSAMWVYEVIVEALDLDPEDLKARNISLSKLEAIARAADEVGRTEDGLLILGNEDQLRRFVEFAEGDHLSARELTLLIEQERNPAAAQSFFRLVAVERVGDKVFVTSEEISPFHGPVSQGQLMYTVGGFRTWFEAMTGKKLLLEQKDGRSLLPPGTPPDLLKKALPPSS